ncbi:hypothetical protein EDB89DRAFT_2080046 [Lactarius sanguifluus]|nr:hypothetical protein EDB89DRAFT_2080046 [Lactarius sanguifluus]
MSTKELSLPRTTITNPEALSEAIQNTGSSALKLLLPFRHKMSRYQILENYVNDDDSVAAYEQAEEHYEDYEEYKDPAAYEQAATDYIWAISARHQQQHPEEYDNDIYAAEDDPQAVGQDEDEELAGETQAAQLAEEILADDNDENEEEDPAEETLADEGQSDEENRLYAEGDADTQEQLAEDEDEDEDSGLAAMPQMFNGDCERAPDFMDSWDRWSGQLSPIFSQYQLATIFLSLFRDPVDQWAEERLAQIEEWRATDMDDDDEDILEDTIRRFVQEFVPRDDAREQYVAAEDPDAEDWSSVDEDYPNWEVPSPPSLCDNDSQDSEEEPDEVDEYVEEPRGDAREEYGCQDEVDDYYYSEVPDEAVQKYVEEPRERVAPVPRKKTRAVKQEPAKKKVAEKAQPAKSPSRPSWEKKFIAKFGKDRLKNYRDAGIPDYMIEADLHEEAVPDVRTQVQELTQLYHDAGPDLQDAMWNATVAPAAEEAGWKGPNTFNAAPIQDSTPYVPPTSWGSAEADAAQEAQAAENTGWFAYQSNPDAMDLTAGRAYVRNKAKCHHCWKTGHTRRNCPNRDLPRDRNHWQQRYNDEDEERPAPPRYTPQAEQPRGRTQTQKPVHGSNVATYAPTTRIAPTTIVVPPTERRAPTPHASPISDAGFKPISHHAHPATPTTPMTEEEFADRLADMQIRRMQACLAGDIKGERDIGMRMNLAKYARSLNRPAAASTQRGRCAKREGNVTVSPSTVPRAPHQKTPNTARRKSAEEYAEEEVEVARLVADHVHERAKSPTHYYYEPGSAQRSDPEYWE